jgi:pimeloyl-ACP methyl ester carboxylesterase
MSQDTFRFASFDGTSIAVHGMGEGRPTLMLHGFMASFERNWRAPGIAEKLAALGRRIIAPDLRGHGDSDAPVDPAAWPQDVLAMDQAALIAHLGLTDYDLVGYSLGARTAVRMMVRGARPARCVLGGMGESGVLAAGERAAMFEDGIRHGEQAADPRSGRYIQSLIAHQGLKAQALLGVLASFAPTTVADLAAIKVPTLVVNGDRDDDNGSAEDLAERMPQGSARRVPGDHLSAVVAPELAQAMTAFLTLP